MVLNPFGFLSTRRTLLSERCSGPFFDDLDGHVKTRVAEFLDPVSLSSFCCTSKSAQLTSMQELWLRHCSDKWGFRPAIDQIVHHTSLNAVYPHCHLVQNRVHHCSSLQTNLTAQHTVNIKYSGPVGVGNRAASSTAPFPEIPDVQQQPTLLTMLLDCISYQPKRQADERVLVSRPFVVPAGGIDVTPYPVAYFEVTISSLPPAAREPANSGSGSVPECIAIGLSHQRFNLTRMPGWDELSFGYHSDDGCLFHGKGTYLRTFGPCYGVGDTVGCGIDYRSKEVFYTLNGKLIGVAFAGVTGSLYPTVGVDANVEVEINFGQKPYTFALDQFAMSVE